MDAWYTTSIDIEEVLSNTRHDDFHIFVADIVKSYDTVDRDILDCVLGDLAFLPGFVRFTSLFTGKFGYGLSLLLVWEWLGHGMGASTQDCPLSMVFIVSLYAPWCRHLENVKGIPPPNSKLIISNAPQKSVDSLLDAAQYTVSYVRVVGQKASPSKCVLLSTSKAARRRMVA